MRLPNFPTEKEWLEWRRKGIGASDAASAIGEPTAFRTPIQLWQSKIDGEEVAANHAMRTGRDKEGPVRDWVNHTLGQNFEPAIFQCDEHPWLMASMDGILATEDLALEIKNAGKGDHTLAVGGTVPRKYWIQCQHQMMVIPTLSSILYISCPIRGNPDESIIIKIEKDNDYINNELYPKLKSFWDLVQIKTMPAPTDKDLMDLGDNEIFRDFLENAAELKKRKEADDRFREQIKQISGGHSCTAFGARFVKEDQKGTVDYCQAITDYVGELKAKHPEIHFPAISYDLYRKPSFIKWALRGI